MLDAFALRWRHHYGVGQEEVLFISHDNGIDLFSPENSQKNPLRPYIGPQMSSHQIHIAPDLMPNECMIYESQLLGK